MKKQTKNKNKTTINEKYRKQKQTLKMSERGSTDERGSQ